MLANLNTHRIYTLTVLLTRVLSNAVKLGVPTIWRDIRLDYLCYHIFFLLLLSHINGMLINI